MAKGFKTYNSPARYMAIFILLCLLGPLSAQFYDGSNMSFGKNRIQYQEFLWQYYRMDSYDVYYYEGGKELAQYVAKIAPEHIRDVQEKLDYVISEHIEFIIYNTHSDFKQSNLGMEGLEGDPLIGGSAQIVGTKVFIYYEGSQEKLIRNLREGIAKLILKDLLYGGNWREVVTNSALLTLPEWYTEGLISYLVDGWTPEKKNRVADAIRHGRYDNFNRLEADEQAFAGFSVWQYIADVYGPTVIPNILYMTRLNRNIESGFIFVTGTTLDQLFREYKIYYDSKFNRSIVEGIYTDMTEMHARTKKERVYSQFKVSPNGAQAALVSHELGQYRVHLVDLATYLKKLEEEQRIYQGKKNEHDASERLKKKENPKYRVKEFKDFKPPKTKLPKIHKAEHKLDRIADESYPILEWSPNSSELSFITEKKGKLWLNIYRVDEGKVFTRELFGLDKVLSFDYSDSGKELIFSAVSNGRSNLYRYYLIGNRQEQLTFDTYDYSNPRFIKDSKKIIFTSNRSNDTLAIQSEQSAALQLNDVFVMDLASPRVLERITSTKDVNERYPFEYDSLRYTFIADKDLNYNRFLATYDSVIARVDTAIHYRYFTEVEQVSDYKHLPLEYFQHAGNDKRYSLLGYSDGRYRFGIGQGLRESLIPDGANDFEGNDAPPEQPPVEEALRIDILEPLIESPIAVEDYVFLGDGELKPKEDEETEGEVDKNEPVLIDDINTIISMQSGEKQEEALVIPKPRNYRLNFAVSKAEAELNNAFQLDFYQPFAGGNGLSPGFSPALQWGISDLFDDRHVRAGMSMLGGLSDWAYGIRYDNLTKRLDKALTFQRQSQTSQIQINAIDAIIVKTHINVLRYQTSYPLSEVFSVRSDIMGMYQQDIIRARENFTLEAPNFSKYVAGGRVQLVFDNTLDKGLNLMNGSRAKIWAEYYNEFDFEAEEYPEMTVIGFDLRHYQKVHRSMIMAFRLAGNTSFGEQKLATFLGGVDNWVLPVPRFENSTQIDASQNYAYQAMMLPMRGFYRNARNGSSAAVANAELRLPLFKYLLNKPINSDFVENFQVVGFTDVGTAWTGTRGPYSDENSFNTQVTVDGGQAVTIILDNQEDPVLLGYGFGLRSRLLGYFVRADWAWGVVDGRVLPGEFYLSLNLDF